MFDNKKVSNYSYQGRTLKGFDYFVNNGIFASFGRNLIGYGDVAPLPVDKV